MSSVNESGGVVHQVDVWTLLERYLILGNEQGDYHVDATQLDVLNLKNVSNCWMLDPARTLNMITEMSTNGRAIKNSTCLAALGWGFVHPDVEVRRNAEAALPSIARTLSHLIEFVDYVTRLRGWGRILKRAVSNWFEAKDGAKLGYQLIKYQQRKGWHVRDLLRLSHPNPKSKVHDGAYYWSTGGDVYAMKPDWFNVLPKHIGAVISLREMTERGAGHSTSRVAQFVAENEIPWEIVPSEYLSDVMFWLYTFQGMPNQAFLSNLPRMASLTLFNRGNGYDKSAVKKIQGMTNVHPIQFLIAHRIYVTGRSSNGGRVSIWEVNQHIADALENAFFAGFKSATPTNKRVVLAIDRSGSMRRSMVPHLTNFPSTAAAAALAATFVINEPHKIVLTYNNKAERSTDLERINSLAEYTATLQGMAKGSTNCTSPIQYCIDNNVDPDAIVLLTDAQHWDGPLPDSALAELRQRVGHTVKFVVICTVPNRWTVVCPDDPDTMNIVGFDGNAIQLASDFIRTNYTSWSDEEES